MILEVSPSINPILSFGLTCNAIPQSSVASRFKFIAVSKKYRNWTSLNRCGVWPLYNFLLSGTLFIVLSSASISIIVSVAGMATSIASKWSKPFMLLIKMSFETKGLTASCISTLASALLVKFWAFIAPLRVLFHLSVPDSAKWTNDHLYWDFNFETVAFVSLPQATTIKSNNSLSINVSSVCCITGLPAKDTSCLGWLKEALLPSPPANMMAILNNRTPLWDFITNSNLQ